MILFHIFQHTPDPVIKSNIAIALGDIAVAFSTIMDDNSDKLYAGLADKNIDVKKNTLMVLTYLVCRPFF
jgi:condensin complex subunit 1